MTLHNTLVNMIAQDPEIQTAGWRKNVTSFLESYGEDTCCIPHRIPDAYRIDRGQGDDTAVITVWEVEVGHPLGEDKLRDYADFWFCMDSGPGVEFEVDIVDRYGNSKPLDICRLWYTFLYADHGPGAQERRAAGDSDEHSAPTEQAQASPRQAPGKATKRRPHHCPRCGVECPGRYCDGCRCPEANAKGKRCGNSVDCDAHKAAA